MTEQSKAALADEIEWRPPTDEAARISFADRLRAWGENCPDPDFFQGEILSMALSDCGHAGVLIHALIAELAALRSEAGAAMREPQARVGRRVRRNVYWRSEPLFVAPTENLAFEIVEVLNAGARALPLQPEGGDA